MSSNYGSFIINVNGIESAHVHRTTSYVADLKKNWAYKNKQNIPKLKNSKYVYYNNDNNNLKPRHANTTEEHD